MLAKRAVVIAGVCCLAAVGAPRVGATDASRTFPLRGTLHATFQRTDCPAGTPVMTEGSFTPCFLVLAHGTIPSLGKVADRRVAVLLHSTTKCMQVRLSVVLTVGARGTIDADAATKRCVDPQAHVKAVPFTITGGTRAFAGATGSGTITIRTGTEGPVETETWKGSLTLPR